MNAQLSKAHAVVSRRSCRSWRSSGVAEFQGRIQESGVRSQNSGVANSATARTTGCDKGVRLELAFRNLSVPATYSSEFQLPILQLLNSCNFCNSCETPKGQQASAEQSASCPRNCNAPRGSRYNAIIAKLTEASYSRCVPRSDIGDRCTLAWRRGRALRGCPREPRLPP